VSRRWLPNASENESHRKVVGRGSRPAHDWKLQINEITPVHKCAMYLSSRAISWSPNVQFQIPSLPPPKKYTHIHSTNITQVTTHTHTYKKSINCRTRNCNNSFEKKMTTTRGFYLWFSEFQLSSIFPRCLVEKGLVLIDRLWKKINSWLSFLSLFIF
jgi:hypothetical protein